MKKAISLLLAILMVMSVIPTAFADIATATFTVTANTQEAKVGDIIEVTVNLANNPGINSFRAKLDFDKTVLKFTGLKEEDDMLVGKLAAFTAEANTNAESEAYGTVGGIRTSNSTANGDFFVALFEVIGEGNVTVGLDVQEFASVADDGTTTSSQPTVTPTDEIVAEAPVEEALLTAKVNGEDVDVAEHTARGDALFFFKVTKDSGIILSSSKGAITGFSEFDITKNEDGSITVTAENIKSSPYGKMSDSRKNEFINLCGLDVTEKSNDFYKSNIFVDGSMLGIVIFEIVDTYAEITNLTLDKASIEIEEGKTAQLIATTTPAGEPVSWSSDTESVATVDENGVVTARRAGEAIITAEVNGVTATCEVTVTETPAVESINLSQNTAELLVGGSLTLTADLLPEGAEAEVEWTTSDYDVATVEDGVVTAVAEGTATITAIVGEITAECTVTVTPKKISVEVGGEEVDLTTFTPVSAGGNGFIAVLDSIEDIEVIANTFELGPIMNGTYNPHITSNDGKFTAEQLKTIIVKKEDLDTTFLGDIQWQSDNSYVARIDICDPRWMTQAILILEVPVVEATGITLDQTELTLNVGEEATVIATVEPSDSTFQDVVWETESSRIAEVAEDGTIKANAKGTTTITATIGEFTAECVVTVNEVPVGSITLDKTEATSVLKIQSQGKLKLTATVRPANATNKFVEWYSDDESIATVDENGVVTGNKVGKTTIHALVDDNGTEYKASCEVEVIWPFVIKAGDQVLEVVDTGKTTSCAMYRTGNVLKVVAPAGTKEVVIEAVEGANFKAFKDHNSLSAVANIFPGNSYTHKVNGLKGSVCFNGTTIDNFTVHVEIEVEPTPVETVEITGETALLAGEQTTLTATVRPADATYPTVTWTSSDESVATVDEETGVVTAVMEGTAIITATADEVEATVEITVTPKYEIVVEFNKDEFKAGETVTANAYIRCFGEKDIYANAFGYALKFNHEDFSFRGGESAEGFDASTSAFENNIVERRITVVAGKETPEITEEGILIDTLTFIAIEDGAVNAEFTMVKDDADFNDCEVYAWVKPENSGSVQAVTESELVFVRIVADDKAAANEIDAIIAQMGDKIEYADFAIMSQAREAYDNADEEVKAFVTMLTVLEEAEKYYAFWLNGDIIINGVINAQDLSTVLGAYGERVTEQNAFININVEDKSAEFINAGDLSTVLGNYGTFIEK